MDKQELYSYVEQNSGEWIGLSDRIWELAELSMKEFESAASFETLLRAHGFSVETELSGIKTAFSGSFGSGRPRIGILGEFDALSSLSQKAGCTEKIAEHEGGCGHGCGHNLLGAASFAAACAIKDALERGALQGTVVFYGCPGEEGCAGKAFLARAGAFRDLDAALCWHPGDVNAVISGSNAACLQYEYSFSGVASHAAGNPEMGRSALDAAELMNVGVQFLREHMRKEESVHYSILDAGGVSPNVVQPTARLLYMVRSDRVRSAKKLLARVNKIAEGAAMMTETTVSWRQIDGTSDILPNAALEAVLAENLRQAPLPQYTAEEWRFAEALRATYETSGLPGEPQTAQTRRYLREKSEDGKRALNDFLVPYEHSERHSPGSSDVGDTSWLTPTAQISTATWTSGAPGHSWQDVSIGKTTIAYKGLLFAAKVLAGTAADLMTNAELLAQARAEFEENAAEGYDCPLEATLQPNPAVS